MRKILKPVAPAALAVALLTAAPREAEAALIKFDEFTTGGTIGAQYNDDDPIGVVFSADTPFLRRVVSSGFPGYAGQPGLRNANTDDVIRVALNDNAVYRLLSLTLALDAGDVVVNYEAEGPISFSSFLDFTGQTPNTPVVFFFQTILGDGSLKDGIEMTKLTFDVPSAVTLQILGMDIERVAIDPPVTGVPEPVTLSLLGAGLAGIGVMRRGRG